MSTISQVCLSIAGFDGSGGAGLQADLKTFSALGCYGISVLTALPIQNTCGVRHCYEIPLASIREQLECLFDDITPDSIKIGMLFTSEIIEFVANFLKKNASNIPIVLDPVMMAKSGDALLKPDAVESLKNKLIPLATIITPNLPEAYGLMGDKMEFSKIKNTTEELENLAQKILNLGPQAVLLKGGHNEGPESNDLFLAKGGSVAWLKSTRIESKNTHGTGCTLSSAIAAYLANGYRLQEACQKAKEYLSGAIAAAKEESVGKGQGPVHHFYNLWP